MLERLCKTCSQLGFSWSVFFGREVEFRPWKACPQGTQPQ